LALKRTICKKEIDFQLAPPNIDWCKAAKGAIQIFKNHFMGACRLCTSDKHFLMQLWLEQIIPQAIITLNPLHTSRLDPRLSAYAHLNGTFDFNRMSLLAPLGTHVVIHKTPDQHHSWSIHGQDGWYLGPALDHYCGYRIYVTNTTAERHSNTVEFFNATTCNMPQTSSADVAIVATNTLLHALQHPAPAAPSAQIGDQQQQVLLQLTTIFTTNVKPTTTASRVDKASLRCNMRLSKKRRRAHD
jgi:hypothetical protein